MIADSGPRSLAVAEAAAAEAAGGAAGFPAGPGAQPLHQQVGSLNAISQFLHDVEEPGTNMPMLPPERPSNAAAGIARGPPSLPRAVAAEHIAAAVHDAELFAEQAVAAARQRTGLTDSGSAADSGSHQMQQNNAGTANGTTRSLQAQQGQQPPAVLVTTPDQPAGGAPAPTGGVGAVVLGPAGDEQSAAPPQPASSVAASAVLQQPIGVAAPLAQGFGAVPLPPAAHRVYAFGQAPPPGPNVFAFGSQLEAPMRPPSQQHSSGGRGRVRGRDTSRQAGAKQLDQVAAASGAAVGQVAAGEEAAAWPAELFLAAQQFVLPVVGPPLPLPSNYEALTPHEVAAALATAPFAEASLPAPAGGEHPGAAPPWFTTAQAAADGMGEQPAAPGASHPFAWEPLAAAAGHGASEQEGSAEQQQPAAAGVEAEVAQAPSAAADGQALAATRTEVESRPLPPADPAAQQPAAEAAADEQPAADPAAADAQNEEPAAAAASPAHHAGSPPGAQQPPAAPMPDETSPSLAQPAHHPAQAGGGGLSTKFKVRVSSGPRLPLFGKRGVYAAGGGHFRIQLRLEQDREPLSVSGYSSEALAAAAYDHARIWQALQQDKEGADMERQRAAVQRLNGELNHGLQRYVADTRLLGKLGGCTRAQLHEQLQPRVLPGWAPWLDTPAVTTRFLGVKRTQGSAQLSAMLHVEGTAVNLGQYDTADEAAVVRDVGVLWMQLHGKPADTPFNLPHLSLDKDSVLAEQLRAASDVAALRHVLQHWVPRGLQSVMAGLQGAASAGSSGSGGYGSGGSPGGPPPPAARALRSKRPPALLQQHAVAGNGDIQAGSSEDEGEEEEEEEEEGEGEEEVGSEDEDESKKALEEEGTSDESSQQPSVRACSRCGDDQGKQYQSDPLTGRLLCPACFSYERRAGQNAPPPGREQDLQRPDGRLAADPDAAGGGKGASRPSRGRKRGRSAAVVSRRSSSSSASSDAGRGRGRGRSDGRGPGRGGSRGKAKNLAGGRGRGASVSRGEASKAAGGRGRGASTGRGEASKAAGSRGRGASGGRGKAGKAAGGRGRGASGGRGKAGNAAGGRGRGGGRGGGRGRGSVQSGGRSGGQAEDPATLEETELSSDSGQPGEAAAQEERQPREGVRGLRRRSAAAVAGVVDASAPAGISSDDGSSEDDGQPSEPSAGGGHRRRTAARPGQHRSAAAARGKAAAAAPAPAASSGSSEEHEVEADGGWHSGLELSGGEPHASSAAESSQEEGEEGSGGGAVQEDGGEVGEVRRAANPQHEGQLQAAAAGEDVPSFEWMDDEHSYMHKDVSPAEEEQQAIILPREAWSELFGDLGGEVLVRHPASQQEWVTRVPGTALSLAGASLPFSLHQGCRILLRVGAPTAPPPARHAGRAGRGGRGGRKRKAPFAGAAAAAEPGLPTVDITLVSPGAGDRRCSACGAVSWSWRRHPDGQGHSLCDACGRLAWERRKSQGLQAEQVQQERGELQSGSLEGAERGEERLQEGGGDTEQQQESQQPHAGGQLRRCLQCGSASKDSGRWASWHLHPATGEEWLCHPCFKAASAALLRQQSEQQQGHAQQAVGEHQGGGEEQQVEEQQEQQPPGKQAERQCLQCGSASKGSGRWASWRRHPATGDKWLCQRCFLKARAALKQQQREEVRVVAFQEEAQDKRQQEEEVREVASQQESEEEREKTEAAAPPAKQCTHCGALHGGRPGTKGVNVWRRHPETRELLCQRCRGYADRHGGALPNFTEAEVRRVEAQPNAAPPSAAAADATVEAAAYDGTPAKRRREQQVSALDTVGAGQAAAADEGHMCCSHCNASKPGRNPRTKWHQHTQTKAWLCLECYRYERDHHGQLPNLQQEDEQGEAQQQAGAEAGGASAEEAQEQAGAEAGGASAAEARHAAGGQASDGNSAEPAEEREAALPSSPQQRKGRQARGKRQQEQAEEAAATELAAEAARGSKRQRAQRHAAAEPLDHEQAGPPTRSMRAKRDTADAGPLPAQPVSPPRRGWTRGAEAGDEPPQAAGRKRRQPLHSVAEGAEGAQAAELQQPERHVVQPSAEAAAEQAEGISADAAAEQAEGLLAGPGKRGRHGGLCYWANVERSAMSVEINGACIRRGQLVLPASMAEELMGVPSGTVYLCAALHGGTSHEEWKAALADQRSRALEAERLFAELGAEEGDCVLLQRVAPRSKRVKLPVLVAALLPRGVPAEQARRQAMETVAAAMGVTPARGATPALAEQQQPAPQEGRAEAEEPAPPEAGLPEPPVPEPEQAAPQTEQEAAGGGEGAGEVEQAQQAATDRQPAASADLGQEAAGVSQGAPGASQEEQAAPGGHQAEEAAAEVVEATAAAPAGEAPEGPQGEEAAADAAAAGAPAAPLEQLEDVAAQPPAAAAAAALAQGPASVAASAEEQPPEAQAAQQPTRAQGGAAPPVAQRLFAQAAPFVAPEQEASSIPRPTSLAGLASAAAPAALAASLAALGASPAAPAVVTEAAAVEAAPAAAPPPATQAMALPQAPALPPAVAPAAGAPRALTAPLHGDPLMRPALAGMAAWGPWHGLAPAAAAAAVLGVTPASAAAPGSGFDATHASGGAADVGAVWDLLWDAHLEDGAAAAAGLTDDLLSALLVTWDDLKEQQQQDRARICRKLLARREYAKLVRFLQGAFMKQAPKPQGPPT